MTLMNDKITTGAFLIARKIFESELWLNKPSSWKVIFIYILGKVSHKDTDTLSRGEGFFNFTAERRQIGNDVSADSIKKFLDLGRKTAILSTTRSTRGVLVKVLKYDQYQSLGNYQAPIEAREKHERSTREAPLYNNNGRIKELNNSASRKFFNKKDFWSNLPEV